MSKKITKEEFKAFSKSLRGLGAVKIKHNNAEITLDEFCGMIGEHDARLVPFVKAWHAAAHAMAGQIDSASEGNVENTVIRLV